MSMHATHDAELSRLLNEYANGEISVAHLARLEDVLRVSAVARQEYRRVLGVHAGLYEFVDELSERGEHGDRATCQPGAGEITRQRRLTTWRLIGSLGACALTVCIVLFAFQHRQAAPEPATPILAQGEMGAGAMDVAAGSPGPLSRETTRPIAIISRMAGVVMASGRAPLHVGQGLQSTRLLLKSGLLHLDFLNGVSVILEGDCDFELNSANRGALRQGRVRVYAPSQDDGFVVETKQATFIDRGTEFGVQVIPGGEAEVHVFDGQVDVLPNDGVRLSHSVTSGQALAILADRRLQEIRVRPDGFPSLNNVSDRVSEQFSQRYHEWRQRRDEILNDASLVAYYDFEPDSENAQRIADRTKNGLDGAVVGCTWSQGRWPGKKALEFKRPHDRVRVNIPGEFESLTLAVWMRLDGFDRQFNSILLTDNFDDGHVHWQVRANGKIDMGIKPKAEKRIVYFSDGVLGFEDLGRWMQLAAVVDRARGLVLHYLDGREVYRAPIGTGSEPDNRVPVEAPFLLRIGRAELGNWSPTEVVDAEIIRNLNGRIDEFLVFSRALDEGEVSQLYDIGRP